MRGRALSLVWLAVMASPLAIAWPDATAAQTTAPQTVDPVTRHVAEASTVRHSASVDMGGDASRTSGRRARRLPCRGGGVDADHDRSERRRGGNEGCRDVK